VDHDITFVIQDDFQCPNRYFTKIHLLINFSITQTQCFMITPRPKYTKQKCLFWYAQEQNPYNLYTHQCFCFDFFHVVVLLLIAKQQQQKIVKLYDLSMLCLGQQNTLLRFFQFLSELTQILLSPHKCFLQFSILFLN
jgi:hypothetical protein